MIKFIQKFAYIYMRISILFSYFFCFLLSYIFRLYSFFNTSKKDLGIFLHSPTGSDGYNRRFALFFKYFEADKLKYQIFPHVNETETYILSDHKLRIKHYLLYQKIAWIRVFQIPKAIFYKNDKCTRWFN